MGLNRKFQLCIREEAQPGVFLDPLAAAYADWEPIEPRYELDVEDVERDVVRGTLTNATPLSGLRRATVRFGLEMAGDNGTDATTFPRFGMLLRACGLHHEEHRIISMADSTGESVSYLHGEVITGGTSGATGIVLHDTVPGQTLIRFYALNGTPFESGEVVTGSTSAAAWSTHASSFADVAAGSSWWPVSSNLITMATTTLVGTVAPGTTLKGGSGGALVRYKGTANLGATEAAAEFEVLDGIIQDDEVFTDVSSASNSFTYDQATLAVNYVDMPTLSMSVIEDGRAKRAYGCRGNFSIEWQNGQPTVINFEFQGLYLAPVDQIPITGITRTNRSPIVFRKADFQVGKLDEKLAAEYVPRVSQFSIDMGNNVAMREDVTSDEGYTEAVITGRNPTLSMNPLAQPEGAFGFINSVAEGEPFRFRTRQGVLARDRFVVTCPGAKVTGNSVGDREGETVDDLTCRLAGRAADGQDREDNEFVLSYETRIAGF